MNSLATIPTQPVPGNEQSVWCIKPVRESQQFGKHSAQPTWHQQPCSPHPESLQSHFLRFLLPCWPSPVLTRDWTVNPLEWLVSVYLTWATHLLHTLHYGPYGRSAAISTMRCSLRLLIFGKGRRLEAHLFSYGWALPSALSSIISKQQTEEQHAGRVIATLGQVRRRRETSPRGDYICFIRDALEIRAGKVLCVRQRLQVSEKHHGSGSLLHWWKWRWNRVSMSFCPQSKGTREPLHRLFFSRAILINPGKYVNAYQTSTECPKRITRE